MRDGLRRKYKINIMKKVLPILLLIVMTTGCALFKKKDKYGCPTNGRNVGAEKLLSGDKAAIKAERKAKFKGLKSY
jgi:hypothetical protein